jgi:TPR repeat protein
LAPDLIPDLQFSDSRARVIRFVRGMAITVVVAAGIGGYLWASTRPTPPTQKLALSLDRTDWQSEMRTPVANIEASRPESNRVAVRLDGNNPMPGAAIDAARSAVGESTVAAKPRGETPRLTDQDSPASEAAVPPQFTISAARSREGDQPAQLIISAADARKDGVAVISGLAPGSVLSAGKPMAQNAWLLSAVEFNDASITPPRGFVGVMSLVVEFRLANNALIDRKNLQLEWSRNGALVTPKSALFGGDADDIASMIRKGADFMARRDIAVARLIFQRAAQSGDAAAAFALAETYDPLVLRKFGSREKGFSDIALAQSWYERARDMGSTLAPERIVSLTQASK